MYCPNMKALGWNTNLLCVPNIKYVEVAVGKYRVYLLIQNGVAVKLTV